MWSWNESYVPYTFKTQMANGRIHLKVVHTDESDLHISKYQIIVVVDLRSVGYFHLLRGNSRYLYALHIDTNNDMTSLVNAGFEKMKTSSISTKETWRESRKSKHSDNGDTDKDSYPWLVKRALVDKWQRHNWQYGKFVRSEYHRQKNKLCIRFCLNAEKLSHLEMELDYVQTCKQN